MGSRQLAVGEKPVERAFEISAIVGHGLGDECQHSRRDVESGMMLLGGGGPHLENFEAQLLAERSHFHHQPAGEARTHALFQAFEIGGRPVGSDDHLAAGIDEGIEGVAEFGLSRFSLEELQVIDDEDVDRSQCLLECDGGLCPQRRHEAVHEFFGSEIEHLALGAGVARPSQRLQEMRLAESHAGMDVEWVEHDDLAASRHCNLPGGSMGKGIAASDHEGFEGQPRIERRTTE